MNFDFLEQAKCPLQWMTDIYVDMAHTLAEAEQVYWGQPRQCGILLRSVAEQICRVYNRQYEVGFPGEARLETFLSYTEEESHNVLVSRFLSVVRKEQRDRLILLRVLGDDCLAGEGIENRQEFDNRMAGNAKRMMNAAFDSLRMMCQKINHLDGLEELRFSDQILPAPTEQDQQPTDRRESVFARLFGRGREERDHLRSI